MLAANRRPVRRPRCKGFPKFGGRSVGDSDCYPSICFYYVK
jgi:hypothetical protein